MTPVELLAASPALFILLSVLLGLIVGSFLNVVIYRLPLMMERDWRAQCAELLGQPAAAAKHRSVTQRKTAGPPRARTISWMDRARGMVR